MNSIAQKATRFSIIPSDSVPQARIHQPVQGG